jgi:hypothetical protein
MEGQNAPKNKILMWMVAQKVILTKDNMVARNWQGDLGCYFCGSAEFVEHLLFQCLVSKVIWAPLQSASIRIIDPPHMSSSGIRLEKPYLGGGECICLALQDSAGQLGLPETKGALRRL